MNRYGRGRIRLWRKHRHTASWKSFAPGVFVGAVCLILPLFIIINFLVGICLKMTWYPQTAAAGLMWGMVAVLYSVGVVTESVRLAWQQKRRDILPYLPIVFVVIHTSYGYGILRELFFPKKPNGSR
jgi:hypothetical protein